MTQERKDALYDQMIAWSCEQICSGWFDEAVHFWESRRETGMSGRQESEIWKS